MRKISYPEAEELERLKASYVNIFDNNFKEKIDGELKKINSSSLNLNFDTLVTASFDKLYDYTDLLKNWSDTLPKDTFIRKDSKGNDIKNNVLYQLFDYKKYQSKIAKFFMSGNFNFKTCFYCDENYIYKFSLNEKNRINTFEFYKKTHLRTLKSKVLKDSGLTPSIEKKFNKTRNKEGKNLNDLAISLEMEVKQLESDYTNYLLTGSHNHFTLDHIFPQFEYPFFSLSLFNLIPSCYSCNSKFKNKKEFNIANLKKISPSSVDFSLTNKLKFKLFLNESMYDINTNILNLNNLTHKLVFDSNTEPYIEEYIKILKLDRRYQVHNGDVKLIVEKRLKYTDSKIKEIARTMSKDSDEIKLDLFGVEYFDSDKDVPFAKMRRDIAEQLNLNIDKPIKNKK